MVYYPDSTYRIQFSGNFCFKDFVKIIPYLQKLGIKTIYSSPLFGAAPGSEHGYDITDPQTINPEIGTLEEFRKIQLNLKSSGIGWIQDIVPNHMAFSVHNPWIYDILENGERSEYSDFFDIDWHHPNENLKGKLILPVLEKPLNELIAAGEISVVWKDKSLKMIYSGNEFPLNHNSYGIILSTNDKKDSPDSIKSIVEIFTDKGNNEVTSKKAKENLTKKYITDKIFREYFNECLISINKDHLSLKKLVDSQYYVPVYWKVTDKLLNYRRFFTINGLICLKIENKRVFDTYHSLVHKLCKENLLQGLRIDHIDGTSNPSEYLYRLRTLAGNDKYIIAEKILGRDESLERNWPVQGETGYFFLALVNNLLTNRNGRHLINFAYKYWNNKQPAGYDEVLYKKKRFILHQHMEGDLDNLTQFFRSLNITDSNSYDQSKIKAAIGELLLNCPVYKICSSPGNFNEQQEVLLKTTIYNALKRSPHIANELTMFKRLFLPKKADFSGNKIKSIDVLFRRLMQFTGTLMAKGGEDTAFYTYNRFVAHNEVGDSPGYFGITSEHFHNEMIRRQRYYPLSMNATSTHDTKRGEDSRARLAILSDIPKLWTENTRHWHKINQRFKKELNDRKIPSRNDEYFIYQTIIGSLPADFSLNDDYEIRLVDYIRKALREGKTESDWSNPNLDYESHTEFFIHSILSEKSRFRKSLKPLLDKIAYLGIVNSISQTLLKFTAPGIPDIYQGSESWNFSFVDPDNRRTPDFTILDSMLSKIKKDNAGISDVNLFNPEIKIRIVNMLLELRNKHPDIFREGEYIPLKIKGTLKHRALAYARRYDNIILIVVIPLYLAEFFDNEKPPEIKTIDWADTRIDIPDFFPDEYENLFTNQLIITDSYLYLSDLFSAIPFGLLKGKRKVSGRKAGILLHITSLPGNYPAGDFGHKAYDFADFLARNGQNYWQVLPLNPVYRQGGYSPYSSLSAFAGNICLISPDLLVEQNIINELPSFKKLVPSDKVNFHNADLIKIKTLRKAFESFKNSPPLSLKNEFAEFRENEKYWLQDYSLFITIRKKYNNSGWNEWPTALRNHDEKSLKHFIGENKYEIESEEFAQFLFLKQWKELKSYCNDRGIKIFGDIPIYVNYDSVDVWSHPGYFKLKKNKEMKAVAGVPPDYFSRGGQLWNMPVFRWEVMQKDGFEWWKNRIRKNLELFDLLRLDHFRGFSAFWEVPAGEKTAINGRWIKGPGELFFDEIRKEFPEMPFVAEDLGEIDQPVYDLRDKYDLPGMRVLQFAFGKDSGNSEHIIHNHNRNCIAYTGTHDNNTIKGWYNNETSAVHRRNLKNYLGKNLSSKNIHMDLIRLAYSSAAKIVIIPFQDFLGLRATARMNTPSIKKGNWLWRLSEEELKPAIEKNIKTLVKTFGRI